MPTQTNRTGASTTSSSSSVKRQALAVALEQLLEPRLVQRHAARLQRLDPLGHDVADDDLVAELGEAGAGDEADPAGPEDADFRLHGRGAYRRQRPQPARDREHRLVRERVEQRVHDPVRRAVVAQHDHVQVRARVVEVELAPADPLGDALVVEHRRVGPVRLLDAPVLVDAGAERQPQRRLVAERVDPDRRLAVAGVEVGGALEQRRVLERERQALAQLEQRRARRARVAADVRRLPRRRGRDTTGASSPWKVEPTITVSSAPFGERPERSRAAARRRRSRRAWRPACAATFPFAGLRGSK